MKRLLTLISAAVMSLLTVGGIYISASNAAIAVWVSGKINVIYADPSDFVIGLQQSGPCGSALFHVRRTNKNFSQMVSLAQTTFLKNQNMGLYVVDCSGERNIVSHGYITP